MAPQIAQCTTTKMAPLLVVLSCLCVANCVPPSVDELSGSTLPNVIHIDLDKVTPSGEEVSLERKQNSFLVFDVRDAFDNIGDQGEELFFYWFVDWDTDNQVEPIMVGEDSLQYFACEDEYDPPQLNGDYPNQRTVMVVASNQPLDNATNAYLATEEGLVMAMVDWSIQFEGAVQCTGDLE